MESEREIIISDVLYGSISFPPLLVKVIDNKYFERLARHLQLGLCYYIYPGATHTRKSHCLGASHLAGVWMTHLQKTQPELHITSRIIVLVRLAALVHDIGHSFFSHLFDHEIAPMLDIPRKDHEDRSVHLFRIICEEESLGLTETEIEMVSSMITGHPPKERSSAWPDYLFQIVAYDIDVDKMDYLQRDSYYTGIPCGFQFDRLIASSRVIDGKMCFNKKVARNILQLFHTRYYMHSEVYQHKVNMIVSAMMADAVRFALKYINLEEYFNHDTKWCELDDFAIRYLILNCKEAVKSHEVLKRLESRNFYPKIVAEKVEQPNLESKNNELIDDKNIGKITSIVGYTNENVNPLSKLWFFDRSNIRKKYKLDEKTSGFSIIPNTFAEIREITFRRDGVIEN